MAANGFDFVDLAVEPPCADVTQVDAAAVKREAGGAGMAVVVHTSPFLPLTNAHGSIREAALNELYKALRLAAELGSRMLTLHFLGAPAFWRTEQVVATYADLLNALAQAGPGIQIAIENSPKNIGEPALLAAILERAPKAGLLLDLGHAHIGSGPDQAGDFLGHRLLARRLCHVHLSDNDGRSDLHLPLGLAYDGTFTMEVFSPNLEFLSASRERFVGLWQELA
jgi:sugar phosphate isomerase/epimerase